MDKILIGENFDMINKSDIVIMSVEEELQRSEQISDKATSDRDLVKSTLREAIPLIKFTEDDVRDHKATKAMLSVLKAYTDITKDEESSAFKRVNTKMRLKEVNNNEQQNEAVQALIMAVTTNDTTSDIVADTKIEDVELDLDADLEASITKGELKDDPNDVTF